jgi:hypothetical protein
VMGEAWRFVGAACTLSWKEVRLEEVDSRWARGSPNGPMGELG